MADAPRPWDRAPKEGPKAWEAFQKYRDAGPSRSLTEVARTFTKSRRLIARWSTAHEWVRRAELFDAWQDGQRLAESSRIAVDAAGDLARARERERERKLAQGDAIAARVDAMLALPLVQRTVTESADGRTTITTIEPVRWNLGHVASLALAAARIKAEALGEPTERVAITVQLEAARLASELGITEAEALAEVQAVLAARSGGKG